MSSWTETVSLSFSYLFSSFAHSPVDKPGDMLIRLTMIQSRTFVGRKDAVQPSPENLLPSAFADGDSLVQLFQDKTISAHDLAALVGAHSTSRQFTTNLTCIGCSQDTTPGLWDVTFFNG